LKNNTRLIYKIQNYTKKKNDFSNIHSIFIT
jgi:hypothetical protein